MEYPPYTCRTEVSYKHGTKASYRIIPISLFVMEIRMKSKVNRTISTSSPLRAIFPCYFRAGYIISKAKLRLGKPGKFHFRRSVVYLAEG